MIRGIGCMVLGALIALGCSECLTPTKARGEAVAPPIQKSTATGSISLETLATDHIWRVRIDSYLDGCAFKATHDMNCYWRAVEHANGLRDQGE